MYKKILKWIAPHQGSQFKKNFLALAYAQIFAQILSWCSAPILSRLFTPEDFGTVSVFTIAIGVLAAFCTLKSEWSIPNTHSKVQAAALMVTGFSGLIFFTGLLFVLLLCFPHVLSLYAATRDLAPYALIIPLSLLITGTHQLLHSWYVKKSFLKPIAQIKVYQSICYSGISLLSGYLSLGALGLLLSNVFSTLFGTHYLFKNTQDLFQSTQRLSRFRLQVTLKRFRRELTQSTLSSTFNALSLNLIPLLFASYFSLKELGIYIMMQRLALSPVRVITQSLAQSFWAEAAKLAKKNPQDLKKLYLRITKKLTLFSIPIAIVCLAGPLYVSPILGKEQWSEAGIVLSALTPFIIGQIIFSPLSHLLVHGKQHWQLYWDIVRILITILITEVCRYYTLGFPLTVFCISSGMLMMYLILFKLNLICLPGEHQQC